MITSKELLSSNEAILVLGSLNAKKEDRHLERSDIYPVQVILENSVVKLPFFYEWGKLGVSSAAFSVKNKNVVYFSTGVDLIVLEIAEKTLIRHIEIPSLDDVHELTLTNDLLWLANTNYDEAVAYSFSEHQDVRRIQLRKVIFGKGGVSEITAEKMVESKEIDHFHLNQIFEGMDGRLYGLVHHVTGRQIFTRVAKKMLKKQGDGGVVDLVSGRRFQLWLKSPHTVRIVDGNYWVFDSGARTINVYDEQWQLKNKIATAGFGRGAALSTQTGFFYAGISERRKRYLKPGEVSNSNMVQVFRINDGAHVGEIPILNSLEQINNIYLIPRDFADILVSLKK